MNWGLSEKFKTEFIDHTPISRPFIETTNIPDPNWLAGFITGESNFGVYIQKSNTKIGHQVRLKFIISQHERDIKLMNLLKQYLECGEIYKKGSEKKVVELVITKITDITNIIIPLFTNNSLHGMKQLDFLDFCKIAKLMGEGKHLTLEGFDLILSIKANMNKSRLI